MLKQQFPMHFFHAHGVALGGEIRKPFQATVESQAATAISSVGGHAYSTAGPLNLKEIVRFERASTQIAAIEEADSYDTVVTCAIEGLNIFNQFTADEVVAHVSSKTPKKGGPMIFRTIGTRFVNLRIGGVPMNPVLVHECTDEYGTGKAANRIHDFHDGTEGARGRGPLTTLVSDVHAGTHACIEIAGNAIRVPDFGVVYLAEYLVAPNARQLNMFRVQLGCGVDGFLSGSGVGTNGSTCPPPPSP